jgi:hypothetical protein
VQTISVVDGVPEDTESRVYMVRARVLLRNMQD